eukprot:113945-Chlamydomonas_euryale.AAC.2
MNASNASLQPPFSNMVQMGHSPLASLWGSASDPPLVSASDAASDFAAAASAACFSTDAASAAEALSGRTPLSAAAACQLRLATSAVYCYNHAPCLLHHPMEGKLLKCGSAAMVLRVSFTFLWPASC